MAPGTDASSPPPQPEPDVHSARTQELTHEPPRGKLLAGLAMGALGVVFGDIGTSPLYALRECFHGLHAVPPTNANILGVLSLVFWALLLLISGNYLSYVMRADNRGEGGILALMALVMRSLPAESATSSGLLRRVLITGGLVGAALLYGDGIVTPAISVLSAVEGLNVATPVFEPFIVPISLVILVALFVLQRRGTHQVGRIFGPVMIVWFSVLAILGVQGILQNPAVLHAVNPLHGARFFVENGWHGFLVLGAVFLVVTGGEALYADMGHFGLRPIRLVWFAFVQPALLLNYFGQGALLLGHPQAAENPFYLLVPGWALLPMVGLATLATVIASQALISGAFSLTQQALQLGYSPRVEIVHTSAKAIGQIYVPVVNWALLLGVVTLVLGFRSSGALAAAYGIAVTTTMVITSILAYFVARARWGWRRFTALPLAILFTLITGSFWGANVVKIPDGGWFPIAVALIVFTLMTTWKRGREILARKMRQASLPLDLFLDGFRDNPPLRVPGTAVFMTGNPEGVPTALLHNLKHNKVLHERVLLLTVLTEEVPSVAGRDRVDIQKLPLNLFRVVTRYGFMENPSVPELVGRVRDKGLDLRVMETTFFLGRETLIPSPKPGMALWREALFSWMSKNARSATSFFDIPPNRVVELGAQVEL